MIDLPIMRNHQSPPPSPPSRFHPQARRSSTDHADGIQCYGPQNADNITIRDTYIKMLPGANNAGIFFANYCDADLTLENVKVDGDGSPNGAIWLPCTATDKGVRRLTARNVEVSNTNG